MTKIANGWKVEKCGDCLQAGEVNYCPEVSRYVPRDVMYHGCPLQDVEIATILDHDDKEIIIGGNIDDIAEIIIVKKREGKGV